MKKNVVYNHYNNQILVSTNNDLIYIICNNEEQMNKVNERFTKKDAKTVLVDYEEWDEGVDKKWILTYQVMEEFDKPIDVN
jgi:hypothetical protein|tara:strand:+ start:644 stop:886 length:243 start_codon:yes stop_codon:yes gene_type:complete